MTLLATRQLESGYGDLRVLFGINFSVAENETIAIIGSNGAISLSQKTWSSLQVRVLADQRPNS
jgi:ABC-type polysaccharide/polyol phosphate transport system ATPase subunit